MLKAVFNNIIVKPQEEEEKTFGNIVVPDLGKEKSLIAEVVDVSNTFNYHQDTFKESEVEVGDLVIVPRMGSQIISVDNEDYIVCKETDIIGIVK